ncbi:MAG: FAD-dependent oxidoreductase [Bacteroidales bacterium]|nr:FAD-dependent oxidoreductase [Bacteroidales bacterium]
MKIAVIGAGPAGLTAAYQVSKRLGEKVSLLDVYEASSVPGGMSRSVKLWDQTVDLGPHRFFSKDKKINELWLEVVGKDYSIVNRKTRIFYNKKFFDYPIKAYNALKGLGIREAVLCMLSYLKQKVRPEKDTSTFEGWVTNRFGKRLYSIFFKTYSEKLWGIKCSQLDSDFASQRIKKLSLSEAIKNALLHTRRNKHATLVEQFAYPTSGTGSVYWKMMKKIEERGGNIHLEEPVNRVVVYDGKASSVFLESGKQIEYDHIISSMPITHLVERLDNIPEGVKKEAKSLKFRNTILVYLLVSRPDLFPDQWLYIHDPDVRTGRITNFRNWVPELYGNSQNSILCMEYWCDFENELWRSPDEEIHQAAIHEINRIGLADRKEVLDASVFRIPRCYPVYFKGYQDKIKHVRDHLKTIRNLHVIGRYGAYKYNNQDHSILMGLRAAENILEDQQHDLWQINTDYEVYQEATTITKTGLSGLKSN